MSGTGRRDFTNELDNPISLFVLAGLAGRNVSSRVCIKGPISTLDANMTRMELEQLRDALNEALGQDAAVTNILDLAHAALRTVDCNILLDAAQSEAAQRVSNAIVAIEAFAYAHRITLTEFQGPREIYCGECTTPNICKYGKCSHSA